MKSSLELLPEPVQTCLSNAGINTLFPIQVNCYNYLTTDDRYNGRPMAAAFGLTGDAVIHAKTGSGKTLAYILPILHIYLNLNEPHGLIAIILAPNADLVLQIATTFEMFTGENAPKSLKKMKVVMLTGIKSCVEENEELFDNKDRICNVIIATPSRLEEHISFGFLKGLIACAKLFVIDEADQTLTKSSGIDAVLANIDQYEKKQILDQVGVDAQYIKPSVLGKLKMRKIICSATALGDSSSLTKLELFNPRRLTLGSDALELPEKLKLYLLPVPSSQSDVHLCIENDLHNIQDIRFMYLLHLIRDLIPAKSGKLPSHMTTSLGRRSANIPVTLVFCKDIHRCKEVYKKLKNAYKGMVDNCEKEGITLPWAEPNFCRILGMAKKEDREIIQGVDKGEVKIVILRDRNSRGLDIPKVRLVVSYDAPVNISSMVHRSGRTARADKKGTAVHMCTARELKFLVESIEDIASHLLTKVNRYDKLMDTLIEEENA